MKREIVATNITCAKEDRPIAKLVQLANQFRSSIYLESPEMKINAKSIMGVMALDLVSSKELELVCDGEDEEKAFEAMKEFLSGK